MKRKVGWVIVGILAYAVVILGTAAAFSESTEPSATDQAVSIKK